MEQKHIEDLVGKVDETGSADQASGTGLFHSVLTQKDI